MIVTICTKNYIEHIMDFYYNDSTDDIIKSGYCGDEFYFKTKTENIDVPVLVELMQDIIIDKNAIISVKSYESIKNIIFKEQTQKMATDLIKYLEHNNYINIDGYIQFRLSIYDTNIKQLLYSVVKKNLCITGDF